jgi:hypothetical protein
LIRTLATGDPALALAAIDSMAWSLQQMMRLKLLRPEQLITEPA